MSNLFTLLSQSEEINYYGGRNRSNSRKNNRSNGRRSSNRDNATNVAVELITNDASLIREGTVIFGTASISGMSTSTAIVSIGNE